MTWSNETVLEFLHLYKSESVLWYPKHISHTNRREVSEAWERIKNNLSIDCSVVDLKKKKESLFTTFRSHVHKKKNCPGFRSQWFAYSLMESFLGGKYECDTTNTEDIEPYDGTTLNTNDTSDPLNFHTYSQLSNTPTSNQRTKRPTSSKQNVQKRPNILAHPKLEKEEVAYRFIDRNYDNDECDLYCQLLAKKLRKLDDHQRDVVMHEIDNLIFRAKMESTQLNYTTSSTPVPRKIGSPVFIVTATNEQYAEENTSFQDNNET